MSSTSNPVRSIKLNIASKLRDDPEYRKRFSRGQVRDEIAMQIRALRERRGYHTQKEFGRKSGMTQSAVSRIEGAEYDGWTFKTLLKVADALDARLRVRFEPIEDVVRAHEKAEAAHEARVAGIRSRTTAMGVQIVAKTLLESYAGEVGTYDDAKIVSAGLAGPVN